MKERERKRGRGDYNRADGSISEINFQESQRESARARDLDCQPGETRAYLRGVSPRAPEPVPTTLIRVDDVLAVSLNCSDTVAKKYLSLPFSFSFFPSSTMPVARSRRRRRSRPNRPCLFLARFSSRPRKRTRCNPISCVTSVA